MFSNNHNQRRTHESPMDFEWQGQGQGPTDPNSPFPQFKPQLGQKRGFEGSQTPSSFIGSSSTTAPQFRNPSFTTPRKGTFDLDLLSEASGVESSPGDIADGEDTPEPPKTTKTMTVFTSGPQKQPIFGKYGAGFLGSSPGRADQRRGKFANAVMANKFRKRQRIDRDHAILRRKRGDTDSESDSEESKSRTKDKHTQDEGKTHWFSSLISGVESRPNLPHVLSVYVQLSLNFFLLGLTIFGIWTFWSTIRADVDKASEDARAEVLAEMSKCARDYVDNGCANPKRAPALGPVCENWERCMNRDSDSVGRAKISAHTFAQILNSFIEPISYKAMIFVVVIVTVCILVNNLAFGMFRSKGSHLPTAPPFFPSTPHHNYQWGAPPQTPQHTMGYDIYGAQTFQQIMPSQTPGQRSPSKGSRSPSKGSRSPSKGDQY